jgi:signal transduction histidine kinase
LPPDVAASLASLLDDTRRLAAVCQDLLLLARADAGQLNLVCEPQDLKALIESAIDDARIVAEEAGVTIEDDLPREAAASVDDRELLRVLFSLFCNAVTYNHRGGQVKISLRRAARYWELTVANTGNGVLVEHHDRLFERFFRVESTARQPGHGLGLSVSRELARAHGGDLKLVSSDQEWTVFCLTLPRTEGVAVAAPRHTLRVDPVVSG